MDLAVTVGDQGLFQKISQRVWGGGGGGERYRIVCDSVPFRGVWV